ncbi:hypothetical protein N7516_002636 [Penicillium verrucosum]|uniref:uncharacterized protein n=1 Tax=Penicillium verrucosum TaxID=60171 RepID=UPI002544F395|nr:uncharacterized protein N7516_002636 [Penicillium verrucosum]KAJ5942468.1 hypothetical protein N7516_002636 [Penicillium verrucosum]
MAPFSSLRATLTQAYPPAPAFTEANVPPGSQNGRVFIVTGGNANKSRSSHQNDHRGIDIQEYQWQTEVPPPGSERSLGQSKAAAQSFAQQEDKLDVLWNNAGTGANAVTIGQRTTQDSEPMIGMHYIATLLFTKLLLPQLRAAAHASGEDNGTKDRTENYGAPKADTWILSREFACRYANDGIISVCLNPGFLKTASFNGTPVAVMFILDKILLSEAIYGAYTELYAGLSPDVTLEKSGSYIIPWGRIRPNEATPRQDLIKAGDTKEEGGSRLWQDYGNKFWAWCEGKWSSYV